MKKITAKELVRKYKNGTRLFKNIELEEYSKLEYKNLDGIHFINCVLNQVSFFFTSLERAVFKNSKITYADFSYCDLDYSEFYDNDLSGSKFYGTRGMDSASWGSNDKSGVKYKKESYEVNNQSYDCDCDSFRGDFWKLW
jgi:uncharacterized protein YjbI with pentapeptide repeats